MDGKTANKATKEVITNKINEIIMDAKTANQLTKDAIKNTINPKLLAEVYDEIKKAVNEGKFYLNIKNNKYPDDILENLRRNGYEVTKYSPPNWADDMPIRHMVTWYD